MSIGFRHILSEIQKNYSSLSWWRNRVLVPYVFGTATRFHPQYPGYGEAVRVMEEDWDNLVILDACRADVFEEVVNTDSFDDYRRIISLGSHSSEWTKRNFAGRKFGDTVYVSANPHTGMIADDSFHKLIELRETEFDEEMQTVLPEQIVETAIDTHKNYPNKRLIVHFMQPHAPFVYEGADPPPFEGTEDEYWEKYKKTLDSAIPLVRNLAKELGGKTVITADHGETYKKNTSKLLTINPHPPRLRLPELVTVPWATLDGERRKILEEDVNQLKPGNDLEDRLRHLGYRE